MQEQIITLATPVFFVLIAIEMLVARRRNRSPYRLGDAISSISLGVLSQITGAFLTLFQFGIYAWLVTRIHLFDLSPQAPLVWLLALLLYDFCYYWQHRMGHEINLMWAAHVVHHQSEHYNLSTALRQTSSGALLSWLFYVPMALLGVPLRVFIVVALIDLLYQFWVHTEQIGKLGWFDRVFVSPSNHRAHHGVNDLYLDKNYGGILILWDRLFGTFVEEHDAHPAVYGTRSPLRSWNPVLANLDVYRGIWFTLRHASGWTARWKALFGRPGWQPADAARQPSATFDLARAPYQPAIAPRTALFCLAQLGCLLLVTTHFLAAHGQLAVTTAAAYGLWLACGLWLIGGLMEARPAYRWLNLAWLVATLVGIIVAGEWFGLPLGTAARGTATTVTLGFALVLIVLPRAHASAASAPAGQTDPA